VCRVGYILDSTHTLVSSASAVMNKRESYDVDPE